MVKVLNPTVEHAKKIAYGTPMNLGDRSQYDADLGDKMSPDRGGTPTKRVPSGTPINMARASKNTGLNNGRDE